MPRVNLDKPTTEYRQFVDWIRGELRRQKKTQVQLADYLRISPVSMSQRMNGAIEWPFREVLEVLEFFGASFTDVYGKERKS